MHKTPASLLCASLLLASTANAAEIGIRPGLWEMTTTSEMLNLVSQIPPDQMQQLTNLARQYGFDMPEIQNGAATSRICITREMADQKNPPDFHHAESGCTAKNIIRTGNGYRMNLVCAGPRLKGTGKAEGSFSSPERFSGRTNFDGAVHGHPVNEQAGVAGRWIGASCTTPGRQ